MTTPRARWLNPRKLLLSKWTAVVPRKNEKHFIVTKLIEPEVPTAPPEFVEIEAVHSRRSVILPWRDLTDTAKWVQGWKQGSIPLQASMMTLSAPVLDA